MKLLSSCLLLVMIVAMSIATIFTEAGYNYQYSETTAMQSLEYAKIAYCPSGNIRSWTCAACPLHPNFKLFQVYDNQSLDSQAYSGYDPDTNRIVVAFRGSYNIRNWISDFTFVKVPYPLCSGCEIHKGFYEEYQSYAPQMLADIAKMNGMYPDAELFCSGHSLGAAVSTIFAGELAYRYGSARVSEYSFGTPRIGNLAYSLFVSNVTNLKTQRVTHKRDPVPHLPLKDMNFLHSTHETWYDNDLSTGFTYCDDYPGYEYPKCSDSVFAVDVDDHLLYLGRSTECNTN